jgi:hypothetical protein
MEIIEGGNYSREETIRGNMVIKAQSVFKFSSAFWQKGLSLPVIS